MQLQDQQHQADEHLMVTQLPTTPGPPPLPPATQRQESVLNARGWEVPAGCCPSPGSCCSNELKGKSRCFKRSRMGGASRLLPTARTLLLLLAHVLLSAATLEGQEEAQRSHPCATTAAQTAQAAEAAQQVCGGTPVGEALRSIRLRPNEAEETARLLAGFGFRVAADLHLALVGSPEAEELMSELRTSGLSIGDRAKVRMLFGDRVSAGHQLASGSVPPDTAMNSPRSIDRSSGCAAINSHKHCGERGRRRPQWSGSTSEEGTTRSRFCWTVLGHSRHCAHGARWRCWLLCTGFLCSEGRAKLCGTGGGTPRARN